MLVERLMQIELAKLENKGQRDRISIFMRLLKGKKEACERNGIPWTTTEYNDNATCLLSTVCNQDIPVETLWQMVRDLKEEEQQIIIRQNFTHYSARKA